MSMNKFMHPRNLYRTPPNFNELVSSYPEFKKYAKNKLDGGIAFDFKDPDGLRCLTTILLKKDFGLDIIIPEGTLVPTLPLRLNYILWLEDLLDWQMTTSEFTIKGIDIGTGATCVFPLLAAKKNGWKMLGTEINKTSVEIAQQNVTLNSLQELISIKEVSESTFLDGVFDNEETFDFCMCNPPFFSNEEDLHPEKKSRTEKRKEPNNGKTGIAEEVIAPGGETEFIKNIIRDSLKLKDRVKIYTTMIGHKSSTERIIKELERHNLKFCQTQFCQGHTMRWALAWTFSSVQLQDSLPTVQKKLKTISWMLDSKHNFKQCAELIPPLLTQLKISYVLLEGYRKRCHWKITAYENTWTGQRRKRREQLQKEKDIRQVDSATSNTVDPDKNEKQVATSTSGDCIKNEINGKRMLQDDEISDADLKRIKLERSDQEPIVEAILSVMTTEQNNKVKLEISYVSGLKEAPQQILQYLKNNLLVDSES